jgi:thiol:disulfide interchange protein
MKLFLAMLTVATLAGALIVQAEDSPAMPPAAPVYDEAAIGADQIAAALTSATRENRRVLVQWGANWCIWCKRLHELSATDPSIVKELLYEYDVVRIDVGRFDKNQDLLKKYGVDLGKSGVPYLTVLAADGAVVANQETGSLESKVEGKKEHDPQAVLVFLKAHEAPHATAQAVYDAALARAKQDDRRVLLHFGAPWCGWCRKLEAWLARPEIATALAKDFVEVKIDTDRMAGGQAMLDRVRHGDKGGIPWYLFLDADGKVLATCDGPQGNIGFPAAPAELAHFRGMLEASCVHLTRDDIAALVSSLTPEPEAP